MTAEERDEGAPVMSGPGLMVGVDALVNARGVPLVSLRIKYAGGEWEKTLPVQVARGIARQLLDAAERAEQTAARLQPESAAPPGGVS